MPQQRMDIRMIKDILRLKYQGGLSHERIAQSLSISKEAVAKYLSLADAAGLDWPSTAELDEASLRRRLLSGGMALSRVVEPDSTHVPVELCREADRPVHTSNARAHTSSLRFTAADNGITRHAHSPWFQTAGKPVSIRIYQPK